MFFIEKKKKTSVWKIIAIAAGVAAVVAAGVAAFMLWKEKIGAQKRIEQEIAAIIEEKFAEEDIEEENTEESAEA
jgi:flagellar basal body-associated protein FliL